MTLNKVILLAIALVQFTSCVRVVNAPGPSGRNGLAFFSVDYEDAAPYSYWDNNHSIPLDPILGEYYQSGTGIFEFEYFINKYEYFYGTYEIYRNFGELGRPYGEPGLDAADNFFMLIADPWGYHMHVDNWKTSTANGPLEIETTNGRNAMKVTISKAHVADRPAQVPKFTE